MKIKKILLLAVIALFMGVAFAEGADVAALSSASEFANSFWALMPPVIAIILALLTKEVYSSLFIGIISGALLYSNFNLENTLQTIVGGFNDGGIITNLASSSNVGILVFLVMLGIIVVMINHAGGSAAYGEWASRRIGSRSGAGLATLGLGALIFVDDYFNCLTVGSVMRPVTDKHRISRAKLAYIIDSTAAPVCIIAPISSWAAAVAGVVDDTNGLTLFISAIPYNFYALLTLVMVAAVCIMKVDFGPMARHERNAIENGDLYTTEARPYADSAAEAPLHNRGKVADLLVPVIILIALCVLCMLYTGNFFSGVNFIDAFANCSASISLAMGSFLALIFIVIYFVLRRVLTFRQCMEALPEGFRQMVPAIMILTLAWTLSGITGMLGAKEFVASVLDSSAQQLANLLPAIVFLVAIGLSFATGTSWGTFGILLPIVTGVVPTDSELLIVVVSACLAGAVCGDHCSPISDTTIMSSTGAQCEHINHVSTQLPYALLVAGISFVAYIAAGFVQNWLIVLPLSIAALLLVLFVIKLSVRRKAA